MNCGWNWTVHSSVNAVLTNQIQSADPDQVLDEDSSYLFLPPLLHLSPFLPYFFSPFSSPSFSFPTLIFPLLSSLLPFVTLLTFSPSCSFLPPLPSYHFLFLPLSVLSSLLSVFPPLSFPFVCSTLFFYLLFFSPFLPPPLPSYPRILHFH